MSDGNGREITLGVVSFLNSRPLIEGLDAAPGVRLRYAVPSALAAWLEAGSVDAALIPVVDLARNADVWERVSDACIASDGETLTVRVFSRVPAARMTTLHVDTDSHTSIALAELIWKRWYKRPVQIVSADRSRPVQECESILLIGDKVITTPLPDHVHQIDLGQAWKEWTGLPFVFAVWAAPVNGDHARLADLLQIARDRGISRASAIAEQWAPRIGWPADVARSYLTRHLTFRLTPQAVEGLSRFVEYAGQEGLLAETAEVAT